MGVPTSLDGPTDCRGFSEVLNRVGDKWTVQVVVALGDKPRRFNDIERQVRGISQQMLTRTLKTLERDGMVQRTVCGHHAAAGGICADRTRTIAVRACAAVGTMGRANLATIHGNRLRYDASR